MTGFIQYFSCQCQCVKEMDSFYSLHFGRFDQNLKFLFCYQLIFFIFSGINFFIDQKNELILFNDYYYQHNFSFFQGFNSNSSFLMLYQKNITYLVTSYFFLRFLSYLYSRIIEDGQNVVQSINISLLVVQKSLMNPW